jgi:hypothetical protein
MHLYFAISVSAVVCIKFKVKWVVLLNTTPLRGIEGIKGKPHTGGELSGQFESIIVYPREFRLSAQSYP